MRVNNSMHANKKILFVLKKRSNYGISYGLVNSCEFIRQALLQKFGVESKIVEVTDNNSIDREVAAYKPTDVIIEALWVVPDKFKVLLALYPQVRWHVRLHSEVPFLGTESVAFEWLAGYRDIRQQFKNFFIASNSIRLVRELSCIGYAVEYLPNIYLAQGIAHKHTKNSSVVDIGCFGAIRPFKNHLQQAVAAMTFAENIGRVLHFHINSSRFENVGEPFLKNLKALFADSNHKLVEHEWMNHDAFIKLVCQMDLGMQVSFTETFNIIAADFVVNDIPIVGSHEIEWLSHLYQAKPTSSIDISGRLYFAWKERGHDLQKLNKLGLDEFNTKALTTWKKWLG